MVRTYWLKCLRDEYVCVIITRREDSFGVRTTRFELEALKCDYIEDQIISMITYLSGRTM